MSNRQRNNLALSGTHVQALNDYVPNFGVILNDKLRLVEEQFEKRAGLRGAVTVKDQISMEDNSLKAIADPTGPTDLVNFQTLKQWSTCEFIVSILDECPEWEEFVEDQAEASGLFTVPWAFGYSLVHPHAFSTTSPITANNDVIAWSFSFGYSLTVNNVLYEIATGSAGNLLSIGVYDKNKNLLLDTGPQSGTAAGIKTVAVTRTTFLPGRYYLVYTADSTAIQLRCVGSVAAFTALLNTNRNLQGTDATASTGAVLPSTLGTLTSNANSFPCVLFEE